MKRRSPYVSMIGEDENEDDIDHITSYCERCNSYGFLSELGPRRYPGNEPIPHDADIWMQCFRCGTIVSKVHVKHENEFAGIIDPPENIHDSQKVVLEPIHPRTKSYDRKREAIKRINSAKDPAESDKDLQSMLSKGKQLISYNDYDS